MDDYKLLYMIADGPLGPTLLVQDKGSGERCVVKQVECKGYTQAMQAYNQALQLKRLPSHPSISTYRHFFVHWDREAHAVFLCIVTGYQELGNLSSFIEQQRAKNEPIDEQLLKNWMGQLVEGVYYAHSNGLLHRNIKPNNILLSSPNSLILGDFTVPVVMDNLREVMMKRGGGLLWLPPEDLAAGVRGERGECGEKSDVWSLGCMLLELASCGFKDGSHYSVLLHRLHRDPSVLEEVLEEVKTVYSNDICQVLEYCLRRSVEQRPSIIELMNCSAMKQCLALPIENSATDESVLDHQQTDTDVDSGGTDEVIREEGELSEPPQTVQDILKAMRACPNDRQSLLQYCIQLWDHTLSDDGCEEMGVWGGVGVLCDTLSSHTNDPHLSNILSSLIWSLSLRGNICQLLADAGAVDLLLKCLDIHHQDHEIAKYVCKALASLARFTEVLAFAVINKGTSLEGISVLLNTMQSCEGHKETVAAVSQLLEELCSYGEVKRELEMLGSAHTLKEKLLNSTPQVASTG